MKAEDGGNFDGAFRRAARSLHFNKEVEVAILICIPSGVAPKEDDSSGVKPLNDRAGHGSNRVLVNHLGFSLLRGLSDRCRGTTRRALPFTVAINSLQHVLPTEDFYPLRSVQYLKAVGSAERSAEYHESSGPSDQ